MERSGGNKLDIRVFLPQNHSCSPNGEILSKGPSAKPEGNTFQTNKRKCSFKWHPQILLEAGSTQTIKGPRRPVNSQSNASRGKLACAGRGTWPGCSGGRGGQ